MRGRSGGQHEMFYVMDLESLVPPDHPLRAIQPKVDSELARLRPHFNAAYAKGGRPSIPPEQLIKATLLQALYSIRSERRLVEEIRYNFLYRWFLELKPDASVWDHSTFAKNRARFAEHGLMRRFFEGSVAAAIQAEATSDDHFSVDGTLIESWASMKSFRPKDDDDPDDDESDSNRWVDFQGQKRGNQTHASKIDPEARLARKGPGQGAKLCHSMHALMENRHGLVMEIEVAEANGWVEREAAERMLGRVRRRHWVRPKTLAADKGYDDGAFLARLERKHGVVPHVATRAIPIKGRGEAAQARRKARWRERSEGYRASQRSRRRVEEIFGWLKTIGGMRKARFVGRWKIQDYAYVAAATFNLIRMAKIEAG